MSTHLTQLRLDMTDMERRFMETETDMQRTFLKSIQILKDTLREHGIKIPVLPCEPPPQQQQPQQKRQGIIDTS